MKWTVRLKVDVVVELDDDAVSVPGLPQIGSAGDVLESVVRSAGWLKSPDRILRILPGGRVEASLTRESAAVARSLRRPGTP